MSAAPPICQDPDCGRPSPHWIGEYGCALSKVWRCPPGYPYMLERPCLTTRGPHVAGCGCVGDPLGGPS